ncbi:MAG: IS1595 family transposase [Planctomycetota bacterium]
MKHSKLSPRQHGELLKLFVAGTTARTAAELVGVHRNTAALFFRKLRERIAEHREAQMREAFEGELEIDESYFGGTRKGKRGRGAAGKVAVFGLVKRGGKVFTQMIADCRRDTLMPIIRRRITPDSVVYSDTFASYKTLAFEGDHHVRINHDEHPAEPGSRHINGIENFCNQAKRHLRKFNGMPKPSFYLFLKECEWRFNAGTASDQFKSLRKLTRR